jgi:hypothetical protein
VNVTITGPNAHSGMFHVHATGCADLAKRPYSTMSLRSGERYEEEHPSAESIVLSVYDNGILDHNAGETWEDYVGEFHFFPCVNSLPSVA